MSKVMTMREAVSENVKSGNILFLSGMQHGEPSAAVHEIVRQKIDHLTLVSALMATTTLLIGEGLLDKLLTGYIFQDVKRSYSLSKARSMCRLPVFEEYSHFGIASALFAGFMGVPFLPMRSQGGTDLLKVNKNITVTECPFTGEKIAAVRAVVPDVGIIHVQRADAEGNAQKWGSTGVDEEGINASKRVIVTTEKIVDSDVIRRDPNRTIIPGCRVNAVVEQPWGAYPMHLAGCYGNDQAGFHTEVATKEGYEAYMQRLVYGVNDWNEYLKIRRSLKGNEYFDRLRIEPIMSEPVTSGVEEGAR